ncbi:glycosyltransferase, partial [Thermodesulfobacteriota bacterium]
VSTQYPDVKIVRNKRPNGFAGAVNSGILLALEHGADFIAVCNNDIKVLPAWVSLTIALLRKDEKVGLVGFDEVLKEAEYFFYDWNPEDGVSSKSVARLPGCLYICSAEAIRRIGLFDEVYFMYGEDNDYFARMIRAGYTLLQTNVPVWHFGEGSSGKNSFKTSWLAYRNALRYAIKNEPPGGIIRMLLSIINQGCNPLFSKRFNDPNHNRLRRYNIAVNLGLFLGSCLWNLLNVVSTLRARNQREDQLNQR